MNRGKSIRLKNRLTELFAALITTSFFYSMPAMAVDVCTVLQNPGQCICHNFDQIQEERCPSETGIESGHDCHLAEFCCTPTEDPLPPYCNFPTLDCSLINIGGVADKFGKCNGCGDGLKMNNPGCCDPDTQECPDTNNLCEECDDGNNVNGDGCSADCQLEQCGDGNIDPFEECDDGNTISGDGCSVDCKLEACGNNKLDAGEECDGTAGVDTAETCKTEQLGCIPPDGNPDLPGQLPCHCAVHVCGNGIKSGPFEECDDGNTTNGDGCSADCKIESCGDGIFSPPLEECDDGNTVDGDGCSHDCKIEGCGDGVFTPSIEQCDMVNGQIVSNCPNNTNGMNTLNTCLFDKTLPPDASPSKRCTCAECGNGVVIPELEQCDDGNLTDGDGCSSKCLIEPKATGLAGGFAGGCSLSGTDTEETRLSHVVPVLMGIIAVLTILGRRRVLVRSVRRRRRR